MTDYDWDDFGEPTYQDSLNFADIVIDANSYEIIKSDFKSLQVGDKIDFSQTLKLMRQRNINVLLVNPKTEEEIDDNFFN